MPTAEMTHLGNWAGICRTCGPPRGSIGGMEVWQAGGWASWPCLADV